MNSITDFIQYELYPALYERIDQAFPELDFRRKYGDWHSSHKLSGEQTSPYREDKTVITKRKPHLIHEQGGETYSLVDYQLVRTGNQPGAKGKDLIEALSALCQICGLTLPESDTEEFKAWREKQSRLEKAASQMRKDLFSLPEAAPVLEYLRKSRGYTDKDIQAMELGYCSRETASTLEGAPYGAGEKYLLAIPYRSGSSVLGFKLRAIDAEVKPKYKNTEGLPKKASLFGLTGLKLTGNGEKDRDLTVVEGELDALHAQAEGVENIVAAAGGELSVEALQEAKRRGVKRITILFDYDETQEKRRTTEKKIEKAIRVVRSVGMDALVSSLPGTEGEKLDVDKLLRTSGKEELQAVVDEAVTGARYLFEGLLHQAIEEQGGEGEQITDKALGNYTDKVIELLNDEGLTSPVERDIILTMYERTTGETIKKETLRAEADRRKTIADEKRQSKETVQVAEAALKLAREGDTLGALQMMKEKASTVARISKEAEYSSLLEVPTSTDIRERLKTRPQGIETNYIFSSGKRKERLVLPAGALTLICGAPSHGKSTVLRNLALQTATNGEPGAVLYFSFEEDMESTLVELLNTYAGLELTTANRNYNNLSTITEYYQTGSTQYIKRDQVEAFKKKEAEFMEKVIGSGALRVYDKDYKSGELVEAIDYIFRKIPVKAVFIDYIQLLYKEGSRLQRNEELKEIAKDLRQLAKRLKLPLVLAAQYSRKAASPTEMCNQYIADSADLEREANKVIGVWSSTFRPLPDSKYYEKEIEEEKRPELGTPGTLYVRETKNRGGLANIDALLEFDGNTGEVVANYVEDLPEESFPVQDSLDMF